MSALILFLIVFAILISITFGSLILLLIKKSKEAHNIIDEVEAAFLTASTPDQLQSPYQRLIKLPKTHWYKMYEYRFIAVKAKIEMKFQMLTIGAKQPNEAQ